MATVKEGWKAYEKYYDNSSNLIRLATFVGLAASVVFCWSITEMYRVVVGFVTVLVVEIIQSLFLTLATMTYTLRSEDEGKNLMYWDSRFLVFSNVFICIRIIFLLISWGYFIRYLSLLEYYA